LRPAVEMKLVVPDDLRHVLGDFLALLSDLPGGGCAFRYESAGSMRPC
jgi:hypothetical protein